jgi:O-Antigen ligase
LRTSAAVRITVPRIATDAFLPYTCFVVTLALLFGGGGAYGWPDAVVQLAALPLLAWALFKLTPSQLDRGGLWAIALLCAILAWPLLQLVPMPPSLWSALPGRSEIASAYEAAGIKLPWLPISLYPSATWFALLSLLPAAAIFLAMLSVEQRSRRILIVLIFIIIFVSVLLDLLQTMAEGGPLRFYAITNPDRAVGFFANANHNAAFLYSAIPFAVAWAIGLVRDHRRNRAIGVALLLLLILTIIIGVSVTRSRAGMALLFVAGLSGVLLAWRHDWGQSGRRLLHFAIGANLVALLLAFQFGFVGFMQRVEQSESFEDIRWPAAQVTLQAAIANMPFGSGFGTFAPIYEKFAPRTLLRDRYLNQAHNDWLDLWLSGGAPAIVLAVGFLAWLTASTFKLWSTGQPEARVLDLALARAAPIVIVLLLLHSMVDYPLRTAALSVLFAVACGYLVPWPRIETRTEISAARERFASANGISLR